MWVLALLWACGQVDPPPAEPCRCERQPRSCALVTAEASGQGVATTVTATYRRGETGETVVQRQSVAMNEVEPLLHRLREAGEIPCSESVPVGGTCDCPGWKYEWIEPEATE